MTGAAAPVVVVTSRSFSSGAFDLVGRLTEAGARVVRGATDHNLRSLRPVLAEAVAWVAGTAPIMAEHLDAAPRLKVIARYGVGFDSVNRQAAAQRGILVTNTPGANSDAVAEHALALLLAALRHIVAGNAAVRAQDWSVHRARELKNLSVGVVGFGRIGQAFTSRLLPFGSAVLVHDPFVSAERVTAAGAEPVDLADMPARCDVVSLHAPGGRVFVNAAWLEQASPGMILINTARAALVNEQAVADALAGGRLASYAADDVGGGGSHPDSPLLSAEFVDRVILTPHSAAQTVEAVDNMGASATAAVLAVLGGQTPPNLVEPPPV